MSRVIRMVILVVVATVLSSRLPVNLVVVSIAALALEEPRLCNVLVVGFASLCMDHLTLLPLGFSLLPLTVMTVTVCVLQSRIYLQSFLSRLLWMMVAVFSYYITVGILFLLRGGASLYIRDAMTWGMVHAVAEGFGAALLAPYIHRFLTITPDDLRRPRSIVVP